MSKVFVGTFIHMDDLDENQIFVGCNRNVVLAMMAHEARKLWAEEYGYHGLQLPADDENALDHFVNDSQFIDSFDYEIEEKEVINTFVPPAITPAATASCSAQAKLTDGEVAAAQVLFNGKAREKVLRDGGLYGNK